MCIWFCNKKIHLADSQKLSRDLLIVCQELDFFQLPVCIFLTLPAGSVVHYNPSKKPNWYFERNSSTNKLTRLLNCMFLKYFSNDIENTHMMKVLFRVTVTLMPKAGAELSCSWEIYLHLHKNLQSYKCCLEKHLHFFRIFTGMNYCGQLYLCWVFLFP